MCNGSSRSPKILMSWPQMIDMNSMKYEAIKQQGGVMVIVVGNGYRDTSSNPKRDWLHFT